MKPQKAPRPLQGERGWGEGGVGKNLRTTPPSRPSGGEGRLAQPDGERGAERREASVNDSPLSLRRYHGSSLSP